MAVLMAHLEAVPRSLAAARPELPAGVDAVIAQALAKDPDDRYLTAGTLAAALAEALGPRASATNLTRGFLFADLRGYTEFVEAHGDKAAVELLDAYRQLVRDVAARFGGAEIKTEGDSFYLVFPSASGALRCGLHIVGAASMANEHHPGRPIRVGVGVHAGESAQNAEGYVGLAVNTAARICAQAHPGEVLVSETVRSLTRSGGDFTFAPRGRRHLKGIAEPVALYQVRGLGAGSGPTALAGSGRGPIGRKLDAARRERTRIGLGALGLVGLLGAGAMLFGSALGLGGGSRPTSSPSGTAVASVAAPIERIVFSLSNIGSDFGDPPCGPLAPSRLYVVAPDGSGFARLIQGGSDVIELRPALSPNGRTVAFSADGPPVLAQIALVGSDGTGLRLVPYAADQVGPYATAPA